MKTLVRYADLLPGDLFVADAVYEGSIGEVVALDRVGPTTTDVTYRELSTRRRLTATFNSSHVTKYLRPGETDPRLNVGRG